MTWLGLMLLSMYGCRDIYNFNKSADDPILAKVGDKSLFKSELSGLIHEGISKTDSAAIIDGYVENWVREKLMVLEAEKNVAKDINLTKLVDDYRSSLLVYNYEKRLVNQLLDTLISESEKQSYYKANIKQYILSHPVFKCIIAKVPSKNAGITSIKSALEKKDLTEALFLIKEKAEYHHIDTSQFLTFEELKSLTPTNMIKADEMKEGKTFHSKGKEYEFFVKVLKYYDESKNPPFDYIESKIIKTILSERKIQLLKKIRQDLYDSGVNEKQFEIYKIK